LLWAATLTAAGAIVITGRLSPAHDHHLAGGAPVRAALPTGSDERVSPPTSRGQVQPRTGLLGGELSAGHGESPPRKRARQQRATAGPDADAVELLVPAEERLAHGQIVEACALGQIAASRAPRAAAVWEFLGGCYMRLALPQEARPYYRKALALAPDGPKAAFIRAMLGQETP
jgi:hypothetical protein